MPNFEVISLRALPSEEKRSLLLQFEREIYRHAFPDPDQREDPRIWLEMLHDNPHSPAPYITVLLAINEHRQIGGGLILEYYRRSQCALATYAAVAPRFRGAGLSHLLTAHAREVLHWCEGKKPIPLFAEMDDPSKLPEAEKEAASKRAQILNALGIVKSDLPYVQPALSKEGGRLSKMVFCAHQKTLVNNAVPSRRVLAFLHEFYQSLGVAHPQEDEDFIAMQNWLAAREEVVFSPLV